jgi:hypothetical protein
MDDEYDIIGDSNLYNFIYKFSSKGNIDKYLQNKIPIGNNDTYVSYFDMEEYIYDLQKSYNNDNLKIKDQFQKDYNRQNITLNGHKYNDQNIFISEMKYNLSNYINNKMNNISYDMIIILLCCQSSFYLPYQLLLNLYEINDNSDKALVCDSKNKLGTNINIWINDLKIVIELNTHLYIKNISSFKNTHKIKISLTIELDKKISDIINPQICVFFWDISQL